MAALDLLDAGDRPDPRHVIVRPVGGRPSLLGRAHVTRQRITINSCGRAYRMALREGEVVGCKNLITRPRRTSEPRHQDDRDGGP